MFRLLLLFTFCLEFIAEACYCQVPLKTDPLQDSIEKYQNARQFKRVLPFAEQWVEQLKKEKKELSPQYGSALIAMGDALNRTGKVKEAETILLQGLEIHKNAQGSEHPDVAVSLNALGILYFFQGDYAKVEPLFKKALEIRKKALGPEHKDVAHSLNNLGNLYMDWGDYPKAEPLLLQALEIHKKVEGPEHLSVAASLNSLGILYCLLGDYPKAEPVLLKALEIRKKGLGAEHILVSHPLGNLGTVYFRTGNFVKAEAFSIQSLEILKKSLGPDHPNVGTSLNNLALFYTELGQYRKAEQIHLQALDIRKKAFGLEHPDVSQSLNNLGSLYNNLGDFAKSERLYLQALEYSKKAFGPHHTDVGGFQNNLGVLNFEVRNFPEAERYFLQWNTYKQLHIQRNFPFLSDNEKAKFYQTRLSTFQANFLSFCTERYPQNKAIADELYNDQLLTKGLLLSSSAKWKHRIKTSGDLKLFTLFTAWEANQGKLNKLYQSIDSTERAGIDSLETKTEKMEKELSLRSENFAKLSEKRRVTWKDVQKILKPGEAAIEMVRVKKFGVEKTVTDTSDPKKPTYKIYGLTDTIYYAALIVKPESIHPEMVLLKTGNDLEGKFLKHYQHSISKQIQDDQSYGKFWEKIGSKLGSSTKVYFSPDGVFHQINLNTLFNPKTKKYLLEEKDIRMVTATKDLVNPSPVEEENKLAELVGFPSYFAGGPAAEATNAERKSPALNYGLRLESTGNLVELPGTKEEVDKITQVLEAKGWEVKNYTQGNALESNIKESYKPRVLHIATHGFFQPDNTSGTNPLLRSGLMLTGAGTTLKGEKNESGEDGILTAYEAMNLNLDNTDLVVLSACETGLGEIKNGEGVYGLQRAFKVAGARSLIMSLWKVDDEATQELMVGFYKNWLAGTSKRAAFLKAQKELKAKYPQPYYWGAFVMVGE